MLFSLATSGCHIGLCREGDSGMKQTLRFWQIAAGSAATIRRGAATRSAAARRPSSAPRWEGPRDSPNKRPQSPSSSVPFCRNPGTYRSSGYRVAVVQVAAGMIAVILISLVRIIGGHIFACGL